jgi:L-ascorbate metabolism protein UlaG (beta-lactamase superfamily)
LSVTITYCGHACVRIEGPEGAVLIDPFMDDSPQCPVKADKVECDAIGITHGHHDHLGDTVRIATRTKATVFCTAELALFLQAQRVKVHPMHVGGSHEFPFGTAKLVPAIHGGSIEGDTGKFTSVACGIVLRTAGFSIYHAGDTALTMDMELLGRYDSIDAALLPIGDNYTMGIEDAVHAVEMIEPAVVIPMHYNTFSVIEQDPKAFKAAVEEATSARCVVLEPGKSYTLSYNQDSEADGQA